ncbi:DNA polymerase III subunit epsilon [Thiosulfatimonas sediminis]|uniref:DNA polymerase III subunit epsilon n=1 Tax=Thiosulfatimonas sediminis TaxID=2675054 RepID=A0A6F8PWQ1_9GAMM|nr:3'-5' exonuclease [Thiosulfatimonas sediminis]BBP46582.1 DNA polymerase III subunit epsilon [Thiosulfatimonas sediminis]
MNQSNPALAQCAQMLNQSDDFQVLRRLKATEQFNTATGDNAFHRVCVIDTETTGLNTAECEIIELGYQIIEFDSQGHFYRVLSAKNFLNEPQGKISAEVTKVTGLTLADVQGQQIPWDQVADDIAQVQLCVAHNAGFDRPVLERYHEVFVSKIWGCSVMQIDWDNLANVGSKSQEFLCWKVGQFFYGAHRALDDVQALSELLAQPIGEAQMPAFHYLLKKVRIAKSLIAATGAPFEIKDQLRSRGYQWEATQRVWKKLLDDDQLQIEQAWLRENNTPNPSVLKLKATDTFSVRAR